MGHFQPTRANARPPGRGHPAPLPASTRIIVLDLPMDLHRETTYAADPAAVFAMLTNEGFIRYRAKAAHAVRYDVTVEPRGAGARTTTRQSLPADVPELRPQARRRTHRPRRGDRLGTARPDNSRSGELRLTVTNAPVSMRGTIQLVPESGGSATRTSAPPADATST